MSSIEDLFGKLAMTTVTTVSRIALSHATNAAIRNVTSYVTTQLPKNKPDTREIRTLQRQLDLKIKNLKPTIDIIARSVADGNRDLEPALEMCNDLKQDIDDFAQQVNTVKEPEQVKLRLKRLLSNVDDAIPSLHLSLRSIENKSGKVTISPSKLIQASSILLGKETKFKVKLYSLFAANQREASAEAFTWKEEFHKCDLVVKKIEQEKRDYELILTEDIDDGLYHEEGEERQKLIIDINRIQRMYYTQSGELLNIEDSKTPVLVVKVSKVKSQDDDSSDEKLIQIKETAPEIIKEELQESDWYAIGLWTDEDNDSSDSEEEKPVSSSVSTVSSSSEFTSNLLLLESVVKLALLEISEQMNHMYASDELISLYM
ncbi:RanGTP-binding protein-domain-containing protein, partial [Mucor mucedo]|uniref:RanGTP-binding protein-domain-containing protein n=1 Tax=Mucor mucedo TaxID=29922 RepID=UPI00221FF266